MAHNPLMHFREGTCTRSKKKTLYNYQIRCLKFERPRKVERFKPNETDIVSLIIRYVFLD